MESDWGSAGRSGGDAPGASPATADERVRLQASLLDVADHAVVATDPEGRILYWNDDAERIFGWPADEALGRPVSDVHAPTPDNTEAMHEALASHRPWRGHVSCRTRTGATVDVASS